MRGKSQRPFHFHGGKKANAKREHTIVALDINGLLGEDYRNDVKRQHVIGPHLRALPNGNFVIISYPEPTEVSRKGHRVPSKLISQVESRLNFQQEVSSGDSREPLAFGRASGKGNARGCV